MTHPTHNLLAALIEDRLTEAEAQVDAADDAWARAQAEKRAQSYRAALESLAFQPTQKQPDALAYLKRLDIDAIKLSQHADVSDPAGVAIMLDALTTLAERVAREGGWQGAGMCAALRIAGEKVRACARQQDAKVIAKLDRASTRDDSIEAQRAGVQLRAAKRIAQQRDELVEALRLGLRSDEEEVER